VRIVLNTRSDDAGFRICIHMLGARLNEHGVDAEVNDWDRYEHHDVAVFMGYDHELKERRSASQPANAADVAPTYELVARRVAKRQSVWSRGRGRSA